MLFIPASLTGKHIGFDHTRRPFSESNADRVGSLLCSRWTRHVYHSHLSLTHTGITGSLACMT